MAKICVRIAVAGVVAILLFNICQYEWRRHLSRSDRQQIEKLLAEDGARFGALKVVRAHPFINTLTGQVATKADYDLLQSRLKEFVRGWLAIEVVVATNQ